MALVESNDGKERAQSCEASIEIKGTDTSWGLYQCKFAGYGADAWSAKMNMFIEINKLIEHLGKLKIEMNYHD